MKNSKLVLGLFVVSVLASITYFFTPTFAVDNPSLWLLIGIAGIPTIGVSLMIIDSHGTGRKHPAYLWAKIGIGMLASAFMVIFGSSTLFNAPAYNALLSNGSVATADTIELPALDFENPGLVSSQMAIAAAAKVLAEYSDQALGSRVEIGTPVRQIVNGKLVYVMLLEHKSFIKSLFNSDSPGYVVVSASDSNDVSLITQVDGKPLVLKYLESAAWGHNVARHVYLNGYATKFVDDFTVELDDNHRPFIVASLLTKEVGVFGDKAYGVVVVDVQTGNITEYSIDKAPKWVDRIQPADVVSAQVTSWAALKKGFFNRMFTGDGVLQSSSLDLVYKDGAAFWYFGLTSAGADDSLAGYVLVNSRTGLASYTRMPGVVESSAAAIMAKVNPEKGYLAAHVLPFNLDGKPVYVSVMTDTSGVSRGYGAVSVENFQYVAVAETLQQALAGVAAKSVRAPTMQELQKVASKSFVIERIGSLVISSDSIFYLKFVGEEGLFSAPARLTPILAILQKGDTVKAGLGSKENGITPIVKIE